jgi:uncharacterized HhH-GPD family protein
VARPSSLPFTSHEAANELLAQEPLAVLLGMLLDQQVPMEWAFGAPRVLQERLGGTLDAETIATMDAGELEKIFRGPPALHRYPANMAKRTQALCQELVDSYQGKAGNVWRHAESGAELLKRVKGLPGFGEQKARVFVGLLGKRLEVRPPGWEEAAADWPSIADVDSYDKIGEIREAKRAMKAKARARSG